MAEGTNQEFSIANVIDEKLIALDLDVHTKEEMLNRLTDLFEEQGKLNDREGFFKDVMWREGEGQTGIGMGVAIPHGKSKGVNTTALAIGTTKNPLEWESLDDEPVTVDRPRAEARRELRRHGDLAELQLGLRRTGHGAVG